MTRAAPPGLAKPLPCSPLTCSSGNRFRRIIPKPLPSRCGNGFPARPAPGRGHAARVRISDPSAPTPLKTFALPPGSYPAGVALTDPHVLVVLYDSEGLFLAR